MADEMVCTYRISLKEDQLELVKQRCELDGYSEGLREVLEVLVGSFLGKNLEDVLAPEDFSNFGMIDEGAWVDNGVLVVSGCSKWKSYKGILDKLAPVLGFTYTADEHYCYPLEPEEDWEDNWADYLDDYMDMDC